MVLGLTLSCGRFAAVDSGSEAAPTLASLAAGLATPEGFGGQTGPDFYDRENLYQAIDGMAPEYISYGCEGLAMLAWEDTQQAGEKLQVEIYDMGSPLGAYGIYSRAHVGAGDFVDVGAEAAVAEDSVEFARGRFFVKILGPLDSGATMSAVARSLVRRIPAGPDAESLLANLPREGLIARTDRWVPDAGFGMEFMRRLEVGRYRIGDEEIELHVAPFDSGQSAEEAFGRFRRTVGDKSPRDLPGRRTAFAYEDKWLGNVAVYLAGDRMAIVVGWRDLRGMDELLDRIGGRSG